MAEVFKTGTLTIEIGFIYPLTSAEVTRVKRFIYAGERIVVRGGRTFRVIPGGHVPEGRVR